jgi:uncharacterized protein YndB with AHSA1/START domain
MQQPIILARTLDAPLANTWTALTNRKEMKEWYFDIPEFRPEVGCRFHIIGGTAEKQYLHLCTVTEAIEKRLIAYSWQYEGYSGSSVVSFSLSPLGQKTRLVLLHKGIESFPSDNPDFAFTNFIEGWNHILDIGLKGYLARM